MLYKIILFTAVPLFQLLLSGDGAVYIIRVFIIHQLMNTILLGETVSHTIFVFIKTAGKVRCYTIYMTESSQFVKM